MTSSSELSFLTWNLAMMERSAEAPPGWGTEQTEAAIRERVLSTAPDLVLFQELPGMVPFVETHGMVRGNPKSHSGHLATLVRLDLMDPEPEVTIVPGSGLLVTFASGLTIANVHLAPGRVGVGDRLEQLAQVIEAAPTPHILVVGDTNTRVDEEVPLAEAGLVGQRPPSPTWNSRRNKYRSGGAEFTAFYTRWFATEQLTVSDVRVWDEPLVVDHRRFHLSDHFALSGIVSLGARPA